MQKTLLDRFKSLASKEFDYEHIIKKFHKEIDTAILIRKVENAFLELFSKGEMNGTVHTCVGQEFSAVAVASNLNDEDWITSNHRCHGHFIAKTNNWKGLIDELRGYKTGVCKGVGSSQHLFSKGFLSNGPQAALIPVGTGIAQFIKKSDKNNVCVSFFGEGTLGEGLIYESMNLASILSLPQVFVLENNLYSQSTPQSLGVSGSIELRAKSFELEYFSTNTWDLEDLFDTCSKAINYARENKSPCFIDIKTYRLNAHSKSDDDRDPKEIEFFFSRDPLNQIEAKLLLSQSFKKIELDVNQHITNTVPTFLTAEDYFHDQLPRRISAKPRTINNSDDRLINKLNDSYRSQIQKGMYFIGEDILDPYGGAFKVSKGLSTAYPDYVIGTPISEGAISGFGIGISMMGSKSFVEIMFGDFLSYSFDQILSNASKFFHMYGFQCSAPVRIRTPMGGKRGYGPTHSQSLEKFFLGMDNVAIFAISSLIDPSIFIDDLDQLDCPAIILENKVDYGRKLFQENEHLEAKQIGNSFGPLLIEPKELDANLTIITYGGTAREIIDGFLKIFQETGFIAQVICLIALNPLNIKSMLRFMRKTEHIVTVEDNSVSFGIGSEIIANMHNEARFKFHRIGAKPYPIPSVRSLEDQSLPTLEYIIDELNIYKKNNKA